MNKYMFVSSVRRFLSGQEKQEIDNDTPIRQPKNHYRTGQERFYDRYPYYEEMGVGAMMVPPRRVDDN